MANGLVTSGGSVTGQRQTVEQVSCPGMYKWVFQYIDQSGKLLDSAMCITYKDAALKKLGQSAFVLLPVVVMGTIGYLWGKSNRSV